MYLNAYQVIAMILIIAAGTMLTRFTPFIIFSEKRKMPKIVSYFSKVLPPCMIGLLVVYCMKDVSFLPGNFSYREVIAILCIIVLHFWKHNTSLSIFAGTGIYIALCYFV